MGIQLVLSKNAENDWTASQNLIVIQPTSQGSPYQNRGWYQDFQVFSDDPAQLPEVDLASAHSLKLFGDPSALDPLSRIEGHNFISAIDRLSTPGFSFPQVTGIRGVAQLKTDTNTGAAGATTVVDLIAIKAETSVLDNAAYPANITNRVGLQIDASPAPANGVVSVCSGIKIRAQSSAAAGSNHGILIENQAATDYAIRTGTGLVTFGGAMSCPSGNATTLFSAPIFSFTPTTVAALPTAFVGRRCIVTNALAPAFGAIVVGGGAVVTPVYADGTAWRVG